MKSVKKRVSLIILVSTFVISQLLACYDKDRNNPNDPKSPSYYRIPHANQYWSKTYGETGDDFKHTTSVEKTSDDGYIIAGSTDSFGAGSKDAWILKLDAYGDIEWEKAYGGTGDDSASVVQQTYDGGYVVGGYTTSFTADQDIWILKLDKDGTIEWEYAYGVNTGKDYICGIKQITDGYIIAGTINQNGQDFWLIKLDSDGEIVWQKQYGGGGIEWSYSLAITYQNKYIVTGTTTSFGTGYDILVLLIDSDGSVSKERCIGGDEAEKGFSVQGTSDFRYIVTGTTNSFSGGYDYFVMKLNDANLSPLWLKTYDGGDTELGKAIKRTNDGGYIVSGYSNSFGEGDYDGWILKLDDEGDIEWEKAYGGTDEERLGTIDLLSDGYIVAGYTTSFGAENFDAWLMKIDYDGDIPTRSTLDIKGTTATAADQTFSVNVDPNVTVDDSNGIKSDTTAIVTDTDAIIEEQ